MYQNHFSRPTPLFLTLHFCSGRDNGSWLAAHRCIWRASHAAAPGISSFLPWGFLSCCGSLLSHSSPCANLEWDGLTTSEYGIREINAPWFGITGRQFQGPFLCSQQDRVPIIHSFHQFINHWISFLAFLVYSLNPPPIRIMSPDEPPHVNPGFRLCFLERPRLSHRASWTLDKNAQHSHQLYQFPAF